MEINLTLVLQRLSPYELVGKRTYDRNCSVTTRIMLERKL